MAENISGPGGDQKFVSEGEFQAGESASGFISGVTFGPTEVVYYKVNNLAVFEGDIVLGTVAELEQTKDAESHDDGRARGVAITGARFRWPNAHVPFRINAALPNQQRVRDAISHWEASTPIRFTERTAANTGQFSNFIEFSDSGGCWSMLVDAGRCSVCRVTACKPSVWGPAAAPVMRSTRSAMRSGSGTNRVGRIATPS
ncbi:M12 family metallopeptidase [Cryobacterium levicorallinum]|uniref:Astacin (Peptidase family M12A) n=1 Tax=Cryobacterium levicorallinum TaxID=995038 RepID=A0ABY1EHH6_9MICO|nr:M12 family metallopeptidase [Cryobacterium levicorallinum]GEP28304.1 hypothetical protein CLE01_29020 [Cryobacterium levicorallinum]SFH87382.1 Astacin (Peptidase family M12A) [Cryobacterium levicorallinum]